MQELSFQDAMKPQEFAIKLPKASLLDSDRMIGVLEIASVFPGEKWKDTCIAEISVR
jgi:hypothetical protein